MATGKNYKLATVYCKEHPGTVKVSMLNSKGAPMLGCPFCQGLEEAPEQKPVPAPAPSEPAPVTPPKRGPRTFFHLAMEG